MKIVKITNTSKSFTSAEKKVMFMAATHARVTEAHERNHTRKEPKESKQQNVLDE